MVEVFKTNVEKRFDADLLIEEIHKIFPSYKANFDLDDCDRILRVQSISGEVQADLMINLLMDFGFEAEVLVDDVYLIEKR